MITYSYNIITNHHLLKI